MSARAIWQGTLIVQKQEIAVKFYSAVVDRQTHFHLLHKRDRTRVEQRMVDAETEDPVPLEEARKAYQAEPGVIRPGHPVKTWSVVLQNPRARSGSRDAYPPVRSIPSYLTARITWGRPRLPPRSILRWRRRWKRRKPPVLHHGSCANIPMWVH